MKKFEYSEDGIKPLTRDIIISEIINEYHYSFFSRKKYKVPMCLRVINLIFLGLALSSICLTLYLIIMDLSYIGFIAFVIAGLLWLLNFLHIQYIINAQIVFKFYALLESDQRIKFISDLSKFNKYGKLQEKNSNTGEIENIRSIKKIKEIFLSVLKVKNKKYVEIIIDVWLSKIFDKKEQLDVADKISSWKSLQNKYKSEDWFKINDFVFSSDSKARVTGLMAVLFSVLGVIIIKTGDANIFYDLFSREGLKFLLIIAVLVIELLFLMYMFISVTKEILDAIGDYINDMFGSDKKPSDLRVSRFIRRLLLNNTIEVTVKDTEEVK